MPLYTVQSVAFKEQKEIGGNPMNIFTLGVTDPNGQAINCELLQRPETAAPETGQQIDGDMQAGKSAGQAPTLKKAKKAPPGGGRGGYDDPATIARITRSHSQEMALRFVDVTGGTAIDYEADEAAVQTAIKERLKLVKRLTDWFDNDVSAAGASAAPTNNGGGQQAQPAPAQAAPAPAQPPAAPAGEDDDIPF